MAQIVQQMWQCLKCSTVRPWGATIAPNLNLLPWLLCEKCERHTEHVFFRHLFEESLVFPPRV